MATTCRGLSVLRVVAIAKRAMQLTVLLVREATTSRVLTAFRVVIIARHVMQLIA